MANRVGLFITGAVALGLITPRSMAAPTISPAPTPTTIAPVGAPKLVHKCILEGDAIDKTPVAMRTLVPSSRVGPIKPSAVDAGALATTLIPINVHFHVMNKGAGIANGDVPDQRRHSVSCRRALTERRTRLGTR